MKKALLLLAFLGVLVAAIVFAAGPSLLLRPIQAYRLIRSDAPRVLPVPVLGVRPSQLQNTWGAARSGRRDHEGIDIFAKRGTPIVSSTRGLIVTLGTNSLGGRIVRVLGPGGEWHYYAHLEEFAALSEGQWVEAGAVIGTVGDSGNAKGTPPHLHYGIYSLRGAAMNPFPRLVHSRR